MVKRNTKAIVISILIPLGVGVTAGWLSMEGMMSFTDKNQPPLSPPAWIFPIAWTVLYSLMGISSYLIYRNSRRDKGGENPVKNKKEIKNTKENRDSKKALTIYGYQLLVNFLWPCFFFNFQWYFFSFLWLVFLWVLVAYMILEFGKISSIAAVLNVPYLLWLSFAAYLNLGI